MSDTGKSRRAKVMATGNEVMVYRSTLHAGKWIDRADCETTYDETQLEFLSK